MSLPLYESPPKTAKELNGRILAIIRQGWCQISYTRGDLVHGPNTEACCLEAALYRALTRKYAFAKGDIREQWENRVEAQITRRTGEHFDVIYWNDEAGRTQEEVIGLLQSLYPTENRFRRFFRCLWNRFVGPELG